jgi:hypothetical protein
MARSASMNVTGGGPINRACRTDPSVCPGNRRFVPLDPPRERQNRRRPPRDANGGVDYGHHVENAFRRLFVIGGTQERANLKLAFQGNRGAENPAAGPGACCGRGRGPSGRPRMNRESRQRAVVGPSPAPGLRLRPLIHRIHRQRFEVTVPARNFAADPQTLFLIALPRGFLQSPRFFS